jgi:predicted GNAT family acetyltransferase
MAGHPRTRQARIIRVAHPLDNVIWIALSTRQASLSTGGALARRIREDIGPFAAAADSSAAAIAALAALAHADDDMSLLEPNPPTPPPGITLKLNAAGVQMVALAFTAGGGDFPIEPLGDRDVADMLALATLTKPGPFRAATHTLGRFVGIRDSGRLVAMAGERMKCEGFTEISAVCTHPDYRGRGYGAALMRAVGDRILREGETPFLHAYASNTGAIALYRHLGFEHRINVTHAMWSRA